MISDMYNKNYVVGKRSKNELSNTENNFEKVCFP